MERKKRADVICLFLAVLLAACAPMAPPMQFTPQEIDRLAREYAASRIEEWGLAKGSPREAKLRAQSAKALSNESLQAAARSKPAAESWSDWGTRLVSEGATYISDDTLRRYFAAKARMVNEATDAECVAYAQISIASNAPGSFGAALRQRMGADAEGTSRAVWRQRLARVSEVDFDAFIEAELEATLARARRINEPPTILSPSEMERGLKSLEPHFPTSISAQKTEEIFKGVESNDPMAVCTFVRILTTAQSRVSGPDASLGLRVFVSGSK